MYNSSCLVLAMVLCEDTECSVCLLPFSRIERIPRLLHCRHTFCEPCLDTISVPRGGLLTVCCPLCRRVTCVGRGVGLQGALWVNSRLWEQIVEEEEPEEQRVVRFKLDEEQERAAPAQQQPSCLSPRSSQSKLKFSGFFRRFSLTKSQQERIVPGSNVEMKSWRRLPTEDTF